jgi:hypothetical protein
MAQIDAGVLPVGENDRLVDMITDRDIAIHGVVEEVTRNMADIQVHELPVLNRDTRLVGSSRWVMSPLLAPTARTPAMHRTDSASKRSA